MIYQQPCMKDLRDNYEISLPPVQSRQIVASKKHPVMSGPMQVGGAGIPWVMDLMQRSALFLFFFQFF